MISYELLLLINIQLFHGTYGAFCRKDGIHQIPFSENQSWNSELGECIDRDLSSSWDEINEWLPSVDQLKDEFEEVLQELIDKLQGWWILHSHRIDQYIGKRYVNINCLQHPYLITTQAHLHALTSLI